MTLTDIERDYLNTQFWAVWPPSAMTACPTTIRSDSPTTQTPGRSTSGAVPWEHPASSPTLLPAVSPLWWLTMSSLKSRGRCEASRSGAGRKPSLALSPQIRISAGDHPYPPHPYHQLGKPHRTSGHEGKNGRRRGFVIARPGTEQPNKSLSLPTERSGKQLQSGRTAPGMARMGASDWAVAPPSRPIRPPTTRCA